MSDNKVLLTCNGCGYEGNAFPSMLTLHGVGIPVVFKCPKCNGSNVKIIVLPQVR